MWLKLEKTQEFIPVNEQMTEKVFLDGQKGWCILQKNGQKYHISDKEREKLDAEVDRELYWKMRNIEDAARGLTDEETAQVKKILKEIKKSKKKEEDD